MQGTNCRQCKRVLPGSFGYSPLIKKWPGFAFILLTLIALPGFTYAQASQSDAGSAKPTSDYSNVLAQVDADQIEVLLWQAAAQGNTPEEYEAYLEQYPDGVFAGMAKIRIERLEANSSQLEPDADYQSDADIQSDTGVQTDTDNQSGTEIELDRYRQTLNKINQVRTVN